MTTWVGTGWKMNKTLAQASACTQTQAATALASVSASVGPNSHILMGAQNAHCEDDGAWTCEFSVPPVSDAGAELTEIAHSERRAFFGETDGTVSLEVTAKATVRHGLTPLLRVGEPAEVLAASDSVAHVLRQVRAALDFRGCIDLLELVAARCSSEVLA